MLHSGDNGPPVAHTPKCQSGMPSLSMKTMELMLKDHVSWSSHNKKSSHASQVGTSPRCWVRLISLKRDALDAFQNFWWVCSNLSPLKNSNPSQFSTVHVSEDAWKRASLLSFPSYDIIPQVWPSPCVIQAQLPVLELLLGTKQMELFALLSFLSSPVLGSLFTHSKRFSKC